MKIKILVLLFSILTIKNAYADLGDDLKTLGLSSLYGSLGGTLVGVAAMAIGGNKSSVVKGASIGLVAGAGIGGYFVVKDKFKTPEGQMVPGGASNIYDHARVNDYDDIYYGKRWEMVGDWDKGPLDSKFPRQLNNPRPENNLMIFFSLFQKNF